jgi:hypothetical protein
MNDSRLTTTNTDKPAASNAIAMPANTPGQNSDE